MSPGRTVRAVVLLAVLAVLCAFAGCSGSGSDGGSPEPTPGERLATAKRMLDATSGVRIGLSTPKLPAGVSGLISANGTGTHAPAFDGTIKVAAAGVTADAKVVALDGVVYAQLPFTSKFAQIDPADYGAPDPAVLLAKQGGLSSLLTSATGVKEGKQVRDGSRVLTRFDGSLPGSAVKRVIPSASTSATFDATFTLSDDDRLSQAVLTGPFYASGGDVTYTITFDRYGTRTTITKP